MTHETGMIEYYARRAQEYERIYEKPERQDDLRQLAEMVKEFAHGCHVFEIACGTGWWTERMSETAHSIYATDYNQEVLEVAKNKIYGPAPVVLAQADAYNLAPMAKSVDAVFAGFWLSHVPRERIAEFLQGLNDTLAPGAKVMALDNLYVAGSGGAISRTDERGNTYQTRTLSDGSTHEVLKNFFTADELSGYCGALEVEPRFTPLTYYWTLTYRTPREARR